MFLLVAFAVHLTSERVPKSVDAVFCSRISLNVYHYHYHYLKKLFSHLRQGNSSPNVSD